MKVAKNLKIGDLVYIPDYEFAKYRTGWNGWKFTVATIENLYVSKNDRKCATVKYCVRAAGKNQLLPCVEATAGCVLRNRTALGQPVIQMGLS